MKSVVDHSSPSSRLSTLFPRSNEQHEEHRHNRRRREDAEDDVCLDTFESAISCTKLPKKYKLELLKQLNN